MILDARLGVLMRSDEPPGQVFDLVSDTGVVCALGVCLDLPAGARVRGGSVRTLVRELEQWANTGTDVEIPDVAKRTAAIVCGEWSPEQAAASGGRRPWLLPGKVQK